jgi:hypothetical protein
MEQGVPGHRLVRLDDYSTLDIGTIELKVGNRCLAACRNSAPRLRTYPLSPSKVSRVCFRLFRPEP